LLGEDATYEKVGITAEDAQFIETRRFQRADIAGLFGVPMFLLQSDTSTVTYASSEQFMLSFVTHCIRPWAVNIEQALHQKLFTAPQLYFPEFNLDAILRGDLKSRYEAYAIARNWGFFRRMKYAQKKMKIRSTMEMIIDRRRNFRTRNSSKEETHEDEMVLDGHKGRRAELSIFDEIGGFGVQVADFKKDFDIVKSAKNIHLMLNTPGGSVTDGMAIYNILAGVRDKLDIEIIGLAASMGSVVALAGRSLSMDEGTYFMIHNPWTISWGDAEQLRHDAGVLDKMQSEIVSIYVARSTKTEKEIQAMMDAETWLTAEEAQEAGFASTVNASVKAAALCDVSRFKFIHAPFQRKKQVFVRAKQFVILSRSCGTPVRL
jgi:ATP-dependent Clp endopeptidase proteolytic subunit ClpP